MGWLSWITGTKPESPTLYELLKQKAPDVLEATLLQDRTLHEVRKKNICKRTTITISFKCLDGTVVELTDNGNEFPSDKLITQIRLLKG